jgi:hypothetical protein
MFWVRLNRYPPVLCRLLAREKRGRPLTTAEIAERSGLPPAKVEAISASISWDGIEVEDMRRFVQACGCDFDNQPNMRRVEDYLRKRPKFTYLKRSPQWESYYCPLVVKWMDSRNGLRSSKRAA